jgi:hypothetical protein
VVTKTVVSLVDDLTGDTAEETVDFGVDGVAYEIDLAAGNAAALRAALGSYVAHARRVSGQRRTADAPIDREQSRALR